MQIYYDFLSLCKDNNPKEKMKFPFEKYGVKLYLLFRNVQNLNFSKDKKINDKVLSERANLLKFFS